MSDEPSLKDMSLDVLADYGHEAAHQLYRPGVEAVIQECKNRGTPEAMYVAQRVQKEAEEAERWSRGG